MKQDTNENRERLFLPESPLEAKKERQDIIGASISVLEMYLGPVLRALGSRAENVDWNDYVVPKDEQPVEPVQTPVESDAKIVDIEHYRQQVKEAHDQKAA